MPDTTEVRKKEAAAKQRQKDNFDRLHRARSLEPLEPGDPVWITDRRSSGVVVEQTAPRSYNVMTSSGEFRRNRRHLNALPDIDLDEDSARGMEPEQEQREPNSTEQSISEPQESPRQCQQTADPPYNPPVNQPHDLPGVIRTRSGRISVPRTFYDPSWC